MGTPLIDIPTGWDPQAKQQQRVALADFSAAPWQGFEKSERGPNNSSLFQPQAAVVVVALWLCLRHKCRPVRAPSLAQKEKPAHDVYWFLVRGRGLERQENDRMTFIFDVLLRILTSLCTCSKSPGGCAFAGLPGVVCVPSLVCIT